MRTGNSPGFPVDRPPKTNAHRLRLGISRDGWNRLPELPQNASGPLRNVNAKPKPLDNFAIAIAQANLQFAAADFDAEIPFVHLDNRHDRARILNFKVQSPFPPGAGWAHLFERFRKSVSISFPSARIFPTSSRIFSPFNCF
jgi:hypothetical protein